MIIVFAIGFSVVILGIIVSLLLRRQLREKYAVMWLLIGLTVLVLSIWPGLLVIMAELVGVQVPANLLFTLALGLLLAVALHLSWELSRAEEEIRRVAEEVAINRAALDRLLAAEAARRRPPND
ncbi:hypothetical protein HMPREF0063_12991 [Aeromicrobium marinum DSM 15272]|uniref:DUF2304 domain-containing protein n=1 Tax=Aeromicrobium marinum DSM 15272 TaxID=585531 RepID=E2SG32_9ACTN|nr:DUF2304 domain-containing protein [Aeromicrobium marinum]EFQ81789.1 hypothetical protein HMPREF0063_12991 [Aeromicrobium marinum DSM 15272]